MSLMLLVEIPSLNWQRDYPLETLANAYIGTDPGAAIRPPASGPPGYWYRIEIQGEAWRLIRLSGDQKTHLLCIDGTVAVSEPMEIRWTIRTTAPKAGEENILKIQVELLGAIKAIREIRNFGEGSDCWIQVNDVFNRATRHSFTEWGTVLVDAARPYGYARIPDKLEISKTVVREVFEKGTIACLTKPSQVQRYLSLQGKPVCAVMAVPVREEERIIAVLYGLRLGTASDFPDHFKYLCESLAALVGQQRYEMLYPDHQIQPIKSQLHEVVRQIQALIGEDAAEKQNTLTLKEMELAYIRNILEKVDGNKREAARLLNITPATLYRKLEEDRK